jgi:hypothetical protein
MALSFYRISWVVTGGRVSEFPFRMREYVDDEDFAY